MSNNVSYESNLKEVKRALSEAQDSILKAIGEYVRSEAFRRAPTAKVAGGNLKNSIKYQINPKAKYVEIGTRVPYSVYVEVGTGVYSSKGTGRKTSWRYKTKDGNWVTTIGNKPQPFLEPAVMQNISNIRKIAEEEIRVEMNKGGD